MAVLSVVLAVAVDLAGLHHASAVPSAAERESSFCRLGAEHWMAQVPGHFTFHQLPFLFIPPCLQMLCSL